MEKKSFNVIHMPSYLQGNGAPDYKDGWREINFYLLHFLQDNKLLNKKFIEQGEPCPDDCVVHTNDLTDEGYEFVMSGADDRYLSATDRGTAPKKAVRIMTRALKKLRDSK